MVQFATLRDTILNSSSTLHYLNGNCTWTITIDLGEFNAVGVFMGPQLPLLNSELTNGYEIKCEVNNSVTLHAMVTVLGELIYKSKKLEISS